MKLIWSYFAMETGNYDIELIGFQNSLFALLEEGTQVLLNMYFCEISETSGLEKH